MSSPPKVLIVANRTAATPALLNAVRQRSERAPCVFHLVVPASPHGIHRLVDPEDHGHEEADAALNAALPELSRAARGLVEGHVGDADPLMAIQDSLQAFAADELLISTLPVRVSRWLHLDLVSKARGLGLPTVHVEADVREPTPA